MCSDLGDVAQVMRCKQKLLVAPEPLTVQKVYRTIIDLSKEKGVLRQGYRSDAGVELA